MIDWVALRWNEVRWRKWVRGRERASEWLWCMVAENDHFVNVRSSLDRVLTTQFDWLEVSLAWNCIECVFADQLSSAIIHHDLIWYYMISSVNLIWTSMCVRRPASNATSGDIVTTLASVATVAVAHPTSRRRWLQIAGSTVCHFTSAARTWAVDPVCIGIVAGSSARRSPPDGRKQKTTCKFTIT